MQKRAKLVEQTRRRITEAAVRLHTSIGPSRTSMAAVAEEAGVTRLTLYRHFATMEALFGACMTHWRSIHPPPDPSAWLEIVSFARRVRQAVSDLYRWYDENGEDLYPLYRDAAFMPATTHQARQATTTLMVDAVIGSKGDSPRTELRAVAGHVLSFWTWHSLRVEQQLTSAEAVKVAGDMVLCAADH